MRRGTGLAARCLAAALLLLLLALHEQTFLPFAASLFFMCLRRQMLQECFCVPLPVNLVHVGIAVAHYLAQLAQIRIDLIL